MCPAKTNRAIVAAALNARSLEDAVAVQARIVGHLGSAHLRPLNDSHNNLGRITGSGGSFDHKSIEPVTNMQDAVLELLAVKKWGDRAAAPYKTPHEAAADLMNGMDDSTKGEMATVELFAADSSDKKRLTMVFRDGGCGMTPLSVTQTIFGLGRTTKTETPWLQGAFGLGGATTFRNAQAVVLVTRRAPCMLQPGEEDRIAVTVLQWQQHGKTQGGYYAVTTPWTLLSEGFAL